MFWTIFYNLCTEKGKKPLQVVKEIGIAHGSITKWKNGAMPNTKNLQRLAEYFEVSVEYFFSDKDSQNPKIISENKKELFNRIDQMTDEQLEQLADYVEYLIEKKKK